MTISKIYCLSSLMGLASVISCNMRPKEYELVPIEPPALPVSSEIHSMDLHEVTLLEILPGGRYMYLKVKEGDREFWLASRNSPVKEGGIYYYREALLTTDFKSEENQKVFDSLYLVTRLVSRNHGLSGDPGAVIRTTQPLTAPMQVPDEWRNTPDRTPDGFITISELFKNPGKYEGQYVQIEAQCTKVYRNIMDRNWLHFKDGSAGEIDLVVTSDTLAPVGAVVVIKARVALDKDFGSGYKYKMLLEGGQLIFNP